jgi:hypothetical protein
MSVDFSAYFNTSSVKVTHIVTQEGNMAPAVYTSAANAVSIDREPIFVIED